MEYVVIPLAALAVSCLTLFSGFGLGTLLMPVFALFFPIETAVAATAVVHGANNALKLPLFARNAQWMLIKLFGIPAIIAAFAGALVLKRMVVLPPLFTYRLHHVEAEVTPVKLIIAVVIFAFAWIDLLPRFRNMRFSRRALPLGGLLSGFFGGLSGHQGAFRSAFLVKSGLTTAEFVGTTAVIAFMVDLARLSVYGRSFLPTQSIGSDHSPGWLLVGISVLAAFLGLLISRRFIRKVTISGIRLLTGTLLLLVAVLMGAGLI